MTLFETLGLGAMFAGVVGLIACLPISDGPLNNLRDALTYGIEVAGAICYILGVWLYT